MKTRYEWALGAAIGLAIWGGTATAQDPVTDAFDGIYVGKSELSPFRDSAPECPKGMEHRLTIEDGYFKEQASEAIRRITGLVTTDGFFTGQYAPPGRDPITLEGTIEDGIMTGAAVEDPCYWRLELSKVK